MRKDNIFSEDIEVPDVVLQKAETAFSAIKTERNGMVNPMENNKLDKKTNQTNRTLHRRTSIKILAAAACMAAMITVGTLAGPLKTTWEHAKTDSTDTKTGGPLVSAIDQIDNMFTLRVKATQSEDGALALLPQGQPVPISMDGSTGRSWVLGTDETDEDTVNYCINIPQLTCEGDGIKSITYSINNGAFQIVQPENEQSIVIDGQRYEEELNTGSIGGDYDEERGGEPSRPFETVLYKSFTVDYNRQSDASTWINLCNVRPNSAEIVEMIWGTDSTPEIYHSGLQKMLDATTITCTVNYADNTTQSADIKVDSQIMTRREAGEQGDPEMDPGILDEKIPAITFELQ